MCLNNNSIEVGDLVENTRDKKQGVVIRISKNGSYSVMEAFRPGLTISTHESNKTLKLLEKKYLVMKDERIIK